MKTVKDYLDLGLVFVDGDKGYKHIIESFAWRNNDGVKPEYNGDVEIMDGERNTGIRKSSKVNWAINPHAGDANICKWRPVVLQSELPAVLLKEDKPMKPVYTAEMHAKGELPPVDSKVKVCIKSAWFDVDEQDLKFEGNTVTVRAAFSNAESEKIVVVENEDGNCACYIIECIKPIIKTIKVNGFDVPAPMSEAPEIDSKYFVIDLLDKELFSDIEWEGDCKDFQWLQKGIVHSTKSAAIAHAKAMLGIDPNA